MKKLVPGDIIRLRDQDHDRVHNISVWSTSGADDYDVVTKLTCKSIALIMGYDDLFFLLFVDDKVGFVYCNDLQNFTCKVELKPTKRGSAT